MSEKEQWADLFPQINAHPTKDPRVFQTVWEKVNRKESGIAGTKTKKYFACIVNGLCYGVDVYRQQAVDARKECEEAYFKIKTACDFYERHGHFPQE